MTKVTYIIFLERGGCMSFFDTILLNSIFVLFPILIYIIFIAYRNNTGLKSNLNNMFFDLVLFSSLFLIIKFSSKNYSTYGIILLNVPLLFSYIKNKRILSIILSIIIIMYLHFDFGINLLFLFLEYITYFLIHLIKKYFKKEENYSINTFTLVKSFYFSMYIYYMNMNSSFIYVLNNTFASIVAFYLCSTFYNSLVLKGEEIVDLNNSLKQFEKEKTLRDSLFKLTHEIKNPIAVCKGYLDMLNIDDKKLLIKHIDIIKSEVNRTLVIIDDFLDYTKIKVNKEIMDINYLLEDTLKSMNSLFIKNNADTHINLLNDEVYIDGDYNRLKQVFVNVLKNALESKSDKKKLKISVDVKTSKNRVIINVSDNGKGMSLDELNNIGKMFYTTKNNGTGLGISLSKEIIELHNGSIKYTSLLGKGTSVEILLPLFENNNC